MSRILIVEDHPLIATMEREFLGTRGHDVHIVATGEEALAAIDEREPDVVLLDLHLRGELRGDAVLRVIRERHGDLPPVIIISGEVRSEIIPALRGTPNVAVLEKPFRLAELDATIQRLAGHPAGSAQPTPKTSTPC